MSDADGIFCCLTCRLVQDATVKCRECGAPEIAALKYETELLNQKQPPRRSKAKNAVVQTAAGAGMLGGYFGTIVAGMLISPIVPVVVFVGALGTAAIAIRHKRRQITTVEPLDPQTGEQAVTKTGVARRLADAVTSIDGDERVLAEEAVLRGKRDGVLFRRLRTARFLLELEGGDKVVVDGVVRIAGTPKSLGPAKAGEPRLLALGIDGVPAAGQLEVAVVREGDPVEITGETVEETLPELAFDRDAGQATVMRGRAKAVVLVRPARVVHSTDPR